MAASPTVDVFVLFSRICLAPSMTSPRGQRLVWAQLSAAAVTKESKQAPAPRDSHLSLPTPRHTFTARGADLHPPLWAHLQAPLSPNSPVQAPGPFLPPAARLLVPTHLVGLLNSHLGPVKVAICSAACLFDHCKLDMYAERF